MAKALQLDIFQYLDYRGFLRDAYVELKREQRGFSYRWFAKKAGMASPNFLKLVTDGKRNLSPVSADAFAKVLELSLRETEFFLALVAFNQAESAAEKNKHFENIGRFRKHSRVCKLERDTFTYLSHWYYPAIRELVSCPGFREDPDWIAATLVPRIRTGEAKKAIEVLLSLGVLERDEEGNLLQGEPLLSTGAEVRSLGVGNFHRQMMARAADSIETIDRSEREISGLTVALSDEGFAMFKSKIQALRAELLELSAHEKGAERVVQFNFQAFPLARLQKENS